MADAAVQPVMRGPMCALAILLLAGCVAPDETPNDPLLGLCPQWEQGPGQVGATASLTPGAPEARQLLAPPGGEAGLSLHGRPFDLVRIRLEDMDVRGGDVRLTAFTAGNGSQVQHQVRDFSGKQPAFVPYVSFPAGSAAEARQFEVYLASIAQSAPPQPMPVELAWTAYGNVTATIAYTATFHYRVCGAEL